MALELGRDFPSRWLGASDAFRQRVFDELASTCELLQPSTMFAMWKAQEQARPDWPAANVQPLTSKVTVIHTQPAAAHTPDSMIAGEIKKRFLREADDVIEQALEPIRKELREWLYQEMQALLDAEKNKH
jgi:hypothetical protein